MLTKRKKVRYGTPRSDSLLVFKHTLAYNQKYFVLSGNLLFYTKEENRESPIIGVIVLELCRVKSEASSGNRNAFRLSEFDACRYTKKVPEVP